jgi:DNA-binding CsgD family transcriptional regulator
MNDMEWPLLGRDRLLSGITRAIKEGPGSAVLEGGAGVGKTRLARSAAEVLRAEGWHVEVCLGSPTASRIPFAAMSHLVPSLTSADLRMTLEATSRAIVARANGASLLLVVDDAHDLDDGSMTLVHRLASFGSVGALVTRRLGESGNEEAITSLWKDEVALRFEIPPLDRSSHDELVARALGSVRAASVVDRLWALTAGNALYLKELVSLDSTNPLEAWLAGTSMDEALTAASTQLPQLIKSKTEALERASRETLELIAFAEPVRVSLVMDLAEPAAIHDLERRSVISVERMGDADYLRTAHPVYGATLRALIPTMHRRSMAALLGAALVDEGMPTRGDALKAARWLMDAHERVPPEVAIRAANEALARGDASLAERLSRLTANAPIPSVDALIALGTAMSVQNKADDASRAFEQALAAATDDADLVRAAVACSRHHAWTGRDFQRGATVLKEALSTVGDAAKRSELRAELAFFSAASGDAADTLRIAKEVLHDPEATPPAVLSALIHSTRARTMLGAFDAIEAELDRGEELAVELRTDLPLALDQIANNRVFWMRFVDLTVARRIAHDGYERSLREGGPAGLWSGTLSWLGVDMGDLDAALGLVRRGQHEFERFDPFHNVIMLHALTALIHAIRGETDEARGWLAGAGPLDQMEPRSRVWTQRAQVWVAADDPDVAARLALAAGERAEAESILTWGAALLYHDAVRLGRPDLVVESLERLAGVTTAPLVTAMADHARAASEGDARQLLRISAEFEQRGSPLWAAEALAQAASAGRLGETERNRLATRAARLAATCRGAATPLVRTLTSPLSARETEIAHLAWAGDSSRDIAKALVVSVRTVENHLASVYRKLGFSGRDELEAVFSDPTDTASP